MNLSEQLAKIKAERRKQGAALAGDRTPRAKRDEEVKDFRARKFFTSEEWDLLRAYQQEDVSLIYASLMNSERTGFNGMMNTSDRGLGKTAETAYVANAMARAKAQTTEAGPFRALYLTKVSLVNSTAKELGRWKCMALPLSTGSSKAKAATLSTFLPLNPTVIVTNYESLRTTPEIFSTKWDLVVVDEVHKLKGGSNNPPTETWQKLRQLVLIETVHDDPTDPYHLNPSSRKAVWKPNPAIKTLFLSGSPAQNKPEELWAYLHLFNPDSFPTVSHFKSTFTRGSLDLNLDSLLTILTGQILRRSKEELGFKLPPKTWHTEEVRFDPDGPHAQVAKTLKEELYLWLDTQSNSEAIPIMVLLEQLLRFRQLNLASPEWTVNKWVHEDPSDPTSPKHKVQFTFEFSEPAPKLTKALQLLSTWQEDGEPAVVFSCFNEPLHYLASVLNEAGFRTRVLTGENSKKGEELAAEFVNDEFDIFLINIIAGAEGLNLQKCDKWPGGASKVLFLDRWWNQAINDQASDRVHRLDTSLPVDVHVLHTPGVDDIILELCEAKGAMMESFANHQGFTASEVREALER